MRDVPPAQASSLEIRTVDATFDRVAATAGARSAEGRARLLRGAARPARRTTSKTFCCGCSSANCGRARSRVCSSRRLPARRASPLRGCGARRCSPATWASWRERRSSRATRRCRGSSCNRSSPSSRCWPTRRPTSPMRSSNLGEASFEYKLDGARIQAHKVDDEVRVFSRNLRDVTVAVPEVVNVVRAMPARELVLDGEAIVLRPDGTPQPFQVTMRRFGRKLDVDRLKETLPITPVLLRCAVRRRRRARRRAADAARSTTLNRIVVPANRRAADRDVERRRRGGVRRAALATGHEGVMAKALDAGYAAGRRGSAWLKVKQARTLDLVDPRGRVGKRPPQGHAQQPASRRARQRTRRLRDAGQDLQRPDRRDARVADEAISGDRDRARRTTRSTCGRKSWRRLRSTTSRPARSIPGGLALRFARVKRYRDDKTAAEADTFATIQTIYQQTTGEPPPMR